MARKVMIVLGVAVVFMAANVFAADANAPKPKKAEAPSAPAVVSLEGTLNVVKDANKVVTSITLATTSKVVYHVTLDEKGKELGNLEGKEVKVKCVVSEKDGQKWIQVHEYQQVEKKKETPPAKPKSNSQKPKK